MDSYWVQEDPDSYDDISHHGVIGMKWGVRRAERKAAKNESLARSAARLQNKSERYSIKAAKQARSGGGAVQSIDMVKLNRMKKKANRIDEKSRRSGDLNRSAKLNVNAAKLKYKVADMTKTTYVDSSGRPVAEKYANKAHDYNVSAAKTRYKMAKNEAYIAKMKRKASEFDAETKGQGKDYIDRLNSLSSTKTVKVKTKYKRRGATISSEKE